jgi:hypothetical protein
MKAARARGIGSAANSSTGHGIRHRQLMSSTTAGVLMRLRLP